MNKRNYYEILGVDLDASDEKIRRAFRKLALEYHPDRNKEAGAEERFKEIYEAYQALSDLGEWGGQAGESEVRCDMCMGRGEIISRWTQELGGKTLRCPKCLASGKVTRQYRRVSHTPLNCTCADCNRRWAEWKRRSRPGKPERSGEVLAQAEEIRDKYAAGSGGTEQQNRPPKRRPPQEAPQPERSGESSRDQGSAEKDGRPVSLNLPVGRESTTAPRLKQAVGSRSG